MNRTNPNFPSAALLALAAPLALAALPGCLAPIVAQSNGYFIDEYVVSDDTMGAEIQLPAELVYDATREELKTLSSEAVEIKPGTTELNVKMGDANITATVLPGGARYSELQIKAGTPAFPKLDTAKTILRGVKVRLSKIKR
jgi:hypothetical protein